MKRGRIVKARSGAVALTKGGTCLRQRGNEKGSASANASQAITSRRKLQITLDVQILDQTTGKTIFERKGLRAEGEYAERDEASGRREAIKRVVNDMVEGAQSQW